MSGDYREVWYSELLTALGRSDAYAVYMSRCAPAREQVVRQRFRRLP
jgi:hypothetical protein